MGPRNLKPVSPATFLQWRYSSTSLLLLLVVIHLSSTHSFLNFLKLSHFFSSDPIWTRKEALGRGISHGRFGGIERIETSWLTFSQTQQQEEHRSIISLEEDIIAKDIDHIMNDKAVIHGKQLHVTLKRLQSYLPLILQSTEMPTIIADSEQAYSTISSNSLITSIYSLKNFTLLGPKNEILAAGIDEFGTLSSIVVAAVAAAYRLRNALLSAASFTVQQQQQQQQQLDLPVLDCRIILSVDDGNTTDVNDNKKLITVPSSTIYVQWSTEIPAITVTGFPTVNDISNNRNLKIQGLSELSLDEMDSSRITVLRLLDITVNNRTIIAIGETLAALRQMSLPLVVGQQQEQEQQQQQQPSLITGLMRDILQIAVSESNNQGDSTKLEKRNAPIYVTTVKDISSVLSVSSSSFNTRMIVPIDSYCSSTLTQIPGSNGWIPFMQSRDAIIAFCHNALPNLANYDYSTANDDGVTISVDQEDATIAKLSPFFEANVSLIGLDGKELLHDRSNVLTLYKSLAALRQTTFGDFTIQRMKAHYGRQSYLTVQWQTTWPISVEGTDKFLFHRNGPVERIEQIQWIVQGLPMNDAEWVRAFVRAIMELFHVGSGAATTRKDSSDRGRIRIGGETIFQDLLQRAIGMATTSMRKSSIGLSESKEVLSVRPNPDDSIQHSTGTRARDLSDEAAISLYQLTRALYREVPLSLERLSRNDGVLSRGIPAARFLTETVELRGLLNEILSADRVRLKQAFATTLASLRAASRNGWMDVDLLSPITLEITEDSNLKMKLCIGVKFPKISTTVPQPLKLLTSFPNSPNLSPQQESMEVGIVVLFTITNGGMISEIRILETRINGMLTPADVVSKWLLDASVPGGNNSDGMPTSLRDVLATALAWATRSKNRGEN
jgi:hypothetical protein